MKRINWILTDNVASAVSFADMYGLGNPVDSDLIFPQISDGVRNDTGLLECLTHTAVITSVPATDLMDQCILRDGYQFTLYAAGDWYTGDYGFARKAENVVLILNGVATYLKRPYRSLKREPLRRNGLTDAAVFTFREVMERRATARQQILELLVHPTTAPQALRG